MDMANVKESSSRMERLGKDDSLSRVIRVGSRESKLARIQTELVMSELRRLHGDFLQMELVLRKTTGDQILDEALHKIGEKSLFTKELEMGLSTRDIDLVVHSLKDLPTTLPDSMVIAAVTRRSDPRDCVLLRTDATEELNLSSLKEGSVLGTSSVRRGAQLKANFGHLRVMDVRGNLNTRLRKLDDQGHYYDALVLALAGVKRMGWTHRVSQVLDDTECLHAVGQGSLAIECRKGDTDVIDLVSALSDRDSTLAAVAERSLMHALNGGCSSPVAAHAEVDGNELFLSAGVWSLDGHQSVKSNGKVNLDDPELFKDDRNEFVGIISSTSTSNNDLDAAEDLGKRVAAKLLADGADAILADIVRQK